MDQSPDKDILCEEIESWEDFEYALREENRLLFSKMLPECGENHDYIELPALKMNTFQLNYYL
jgi:hypothetical protein